MTLESKQKSPIKGAFFIDTKNLKFVALSYIRFIKISLIHE